MDEKEKFVSVLMMVPRGKYKGVEFRFTKMPELSCVDENLKVTFDYELISEVVDPDDFEGELIQLITEDLVNLSKGDLPI